MIENFIFKFVINNYGVLFVEESRKRNRNRNSNSSII